MGVVVIIVKQPPLPITIYLRDRQNCSGQCNVLKVCCIHVTFADVIRHILTLSLKL